MPVATYGYRHEAEFAAGFLENAEIPYRLQFDDPTLGTSVVMRATLWVLTDDAERAREILEVDSGGSGMNLTAPAPTPRVSAHRRHGSVSWPRLEVRERLLAGGITVALVALSPTLAGVTFGPEAAIFGSLAFGLAGLFGRAPRSIRGLLAGLTGGAP